MHVSLGVGVYMWVCMHMSECACTFLCVFACMHACICVSELPMSPMSPLSPPHPLPHAPLTQTLMGISRGASGPGPVLEEGCTALTVRARGVMLAMTHHLACRVGAALVGMAVTFAPGKDMKGREGGP